MTGTVEFIQRIRYVEIPDEKGEIQVYAIPDTDENVQELVRCKDCRHYRYYGLSEETVSECRIDHCDNPDADWFCADGERNDI